VDKALEKSLKGAKGKPPARIVGKHRPAVFAMIPPVDKPKPRSTKLPTVAAVLTKREMEQVLTVGQGRGVSGEGSLKGRLLVKDGFPYLHTIAATSGS